MAYLKLRFFPAFLVILLGFPSVSISANFTNALNASEDWQEDRWVVSYIGESFVIASVNGQITHGDRLRLRLQFGDCDNASVITHVYTMKGNEEILDISEKDIAINVDGNRAAGTILEPYKFLRGHRFFLYLGYSDINSLKKYFSELTSTTLELLDSDELKVTDYVDLTRNEWSLTGFNEAIVKAQATCRAGKRLES